MVNIATVDDGIELITHFNEETKEMDVVIPAIDQGVWRFTSEASERAVMGACSGVFLEFRHKDQLPPKAIPPTPELVTENMAEILRRAIDAELLVKSEVEGL
jgi:hypothetical protein